MKKILMEMFGNPNADPRGFLLSLIGFGIVAAAMMFAGWLFLVCLLSQ